MKVSLKFDEKYFSTGRYEKVDFDKKFSMYWWSCRFYANLTRKFCRRGKLIDIGCGLGHILARLEGNFETYGIDVNPWAIERAKTISLKSQFFCIPAEEIGRFKENDFEVVIMRHLIEHVKDPALVIGEASRLLKKGGFIILATPNPEGLAAKITKKRWVGYKDPTHISIKPPKFWLDLLRKNGFSIKLKTTDGFWAAPYLPIIPDFIQKIVFGFPGGVQAIVGFTFLPVSWGESLIVVAEKH